MSEDAVVIEDVIADLERVQKFDASDLRQSTRLGVESDFSEAVEPARRLIDVFRKLPADSVNEFTFQQKKQIQSWCKSVYRLFDEAKTIKPADGDFNNRRENLINQIKQAHDEYLEKLQLLISFAVARTVDFNALTAEARGAVQSIRDENKSIQAELDQVSREAEKLLQQVKDAAAEQGVSQQAKYFKDEAELHGKAAYKWLWASILNAGLLMLYSALTMFFPYWEVFTSDSLMEAVQITASKLLVFAVLAFSMAQCVKTYQAHKHNEVTNRHRQNALMTYTTLAEAAGALETKDVVLQYAAGAIYSPHDSGYLKNEDRGVLPVPVMGLTPKSFGSGQAQAE